MKRNIYNLTYNYLKEQKRKRVKSRDIEHHLVGKFGMVEWEKAGGYNAFADTIKTLVQEEVLRPVKAWKLNGMNPPLYVGYQIILQDNKLDGHEIQKLLTRCNPMINVSYYFTHAAEYKEDKPYLKVFNDFLQKNELNQLHAITVNERSFQIFHDEKWLLSTHGNNFLQRIGLTLQDLHCYTTHEPFFYFQKPLYKGEKLNVLIIENKDTFFSLKTLFQRDTNSWGNTSFSLLVYGEGRKIEKSFTFFWELEEYRGVVPNFYYFGDLDPEGVLIWYDLQNKQQINIRPFAFFYEKLISEFYNLAQPIKKEQTVSHEAIRAFLAHLSPEKAKAAFTILKSNLYLPQEALNYHLLNTIADKTVERETSCHELDAGNI